MQHNGDGIVLKYSESLYQLKAPGLSFLWVVKVCNIGVTILTLLQLQTLIEQREGQTTPNNAPGLNKVDR